MPWTRRSLLLAILSSLLVLTAATGQQPATSPAAPKPQAPQPAPPATKPDAAATKLLDDAIAQVDLKKLRGLRTTFWQQAEAQGLNYEANGRYVAAPEDELHLDLQVRLAETSGRLEVVSDGTTLYRVFRVGTGEPAVTKIELKDALNELKDVKDAARIRSDFFRSECFTGLQPLLQSIRQRMVVTGQENVHWQGREMTKLTATWASDIAARAKQLSPQGQNWPPFMSRQCCLYLEAIDKQHTLWPRRIEWWGPAPPRSGDVLLLQLEFREPSFGPLPPEQVAKEFKATLPAGAQPVDMTGQYKQLFSRIATTQNAGAMSSAGVLSTAGLMSSSGSVSTAVP
jgi:hypothetical protein